MAGPTRQPSFRDRLSGIGLSWQSKKSQSYSAKPSPTQIEDTGAKSASVDSHGYVNPLDIPTPAPIETEPESLPISPLTLEADTSAQTSPVATETSPTEKKTLTRTLTQPQNTVEYMVSSTDTLVGIAARFDTTPSELVKLNRLVSRFIFPGQTLYVPSKSGDLISDNETSNQSARSPSDKTMSPKPGHVERVNSPSGTTQRFFGSLGSSEDRDLPPLNIETETDNPNHGQFDGKFPERFIKINSKHITDGQGFVSGVLLVTPNALMFDPNVSDTLVIEHGVETYGVIAPMEMMIRAAIYYDIAHMRVKDAQDITQSNQNKPKIYLGPGSSPAPPSSVQEQLYWPLQEAQTVIKADTPDLITFDQCPADDNQLKENEEERGEAAKKPAVVSVVAIPPPTLEVNLSEERHSSDAQRSDSIEVMISTPPPDLSSEGLTPTSKYPPERLMGGLPQSESDMTITTTLTSEETEEVAISEKLGRSATVREGSRNTQSRRERMLKRLSYPVESLSSISKILSSSPRNLVDFSSGLFGGGVGSGGGGGMDHEKDDNDSNNDYFYTQSPETEHFPETQLVNVGYKNMFEGKPDIFAEVDKLLPRPARQYEGQPLYLCLRMGNPLNKKNVWSTPIASYSKKRMKKEYWFSIPRARVDDLYSFFQHWCPDVYGDVDEITPEARGFEPIDSDQEDEDEKVDDQKEELIKSKEGDSTTDAPKKERNRGPLSFLKLVEGHFAADGSNSPFDWELVSMSEAENSPEIELPLPDLSDNSEIFTDEHRKELCKNLPARAEGYPWSLIYSTSKHGFSLKTMYREMTKFETPVMIAVMDTQGTVFGAVISCSLKVSDHFYGTGESFLFTFHPVFKCYHWTGENMYFIKGNSESLVIGAGDGSFGIWLDGDLYHGSSHCCKTFGNKEPLSAQEDFVVQALEAWGFV